MPHQIPDMTTRGSLLRSYFGLVENTREYEVKRREFTERYSWLLMHWCDPISEITVDEDEDVTSQEASTVENEKTGIRTCTICGRFHTRVGVCGDDTEIVENVLSAVFKRLSRSFQLDQKFRFRDYLHKSLANATVKYWAEHNPNRFFSWLQQKKFNYDHLHTKITQCLDSGNSDTTALKQEVGKEIRTWLLENAFLNGSDIDNIEAIFVTTVIRTYRNDRHSMQLKRKNLADLLTRRLKLPHGTADAGEFNLDQECLVAADKIILVELDALFSQQLSLVVIGDLLSAVKNDRQRTLLLGQMLEYTHCEIAAMLGRSLSTDEEIKQARDMVSQAIRRMDPALEELTGATAIQSRGKRWLDDMRSLFDYADDLGTKASVGEDEVNSMPPVFGPHPLKLSPPARAYWLSIGLYGGIDRETQRMLFGRGLGCAPEAVARWLGKPIGAEDERAQAIAKVETACQTANREIESNLESLQEFFRIV